MTANAVIRRRPALGSSPLTADAPRQERFERAHRKAFGAVVAKRNLTAEVEQQFREAKRGST